MMKIGVWGKTHGDEPAPIRVVNGLIEQGLDGVTPGFVDIFSAEGVREPNMNGFYPGGETDGQRDQRALEVLALNRGADLVLDLHGTREHPNARDYASINTEAVDVKKLPRMFGLLKMLGVQDIVVFNFNSMLRHSPNALLIEIGRRPDNPLADAEGWRAPLSMLVADEISVVSPSPDDFAWYELIDDVSTKRYSNHKELLDGLSALRPFDRLPQEAATILGHPDKDLVALCWTPDHPRWVAELAVKVPTPQFG